MLTKSYKIFDPVISFQGTLPEKIPPRRQDDCTERDAQESSSLWKISSHLSGGSWVRKRQPRHTVGPSASILWALQDPSWARPMEAAKGPRVTEEWTSHGSVTMR